MNIYRTIGSLVVYSKSSLFFFHEVAHFILFCREVWPERNEFGTADISPEDEFMALREIFMTSLPSKFIFTVIFLNDGTP